MRISGHFFASIICTLIALSPAYAGGYMIQETNTLYAQAYAGRAAITDDLTAMFVNPATMGYMKKHQIAAHASGIFPYSKLKIGPHTTTAGNNGGNGGVDAVVPSFYAMANLNPCVKIGMAVTSPWGLSTHYNPRWVGRFVATKTKLRTFNFNPAIAFKGNCISIGAGLSIERAEASLSKIIAVTVPVAIGGTSSEVDSKLRGDNTAWGANLGLILELTKKTRVGLAYRSPIKHNLKGKIIFNNLPNFGLTGPELAPFFTSGPVQAKLKTPDVANLSMVHDYNTCYSIMGDVMFTRWTVLRSVQPTRRGGGAPIPAEIQGWHNTVMVSLGANYRPDKCWVWRAGTAYDQSPTKNKYRNPRLPDQDRVWLTIGGDYNYNECVTLKFAYAHLFTRKAKIDNAVAARVGNLPVLGPTTLLPGSRVQGHFRNHVDIVGLQMNLKL